MNDFVCISSLFCRHSISLYLLKETKYEYLSCFEQVPQVKRRRLNEERQPDEIKLVVDEIINIIEFKEREADLEEGECL